jgi:uncharacterized protein (TIGR02594 family)
MRHIYASESIHGNKYDIGDVTRGGSYGPFQANMMSGSIGDQMLKAGIDPRKPGTLGEQAKFVAKYIRSHPGADFSKIWHGLQHPDRFGHLTGGYAPGTMGASAGSLTTPGNRPSGGSTPLNAQGVTKSAAAAADFAQTMQGLKDHDPRGHALIQQYLTSGGAGMDPAVTAWCAAFVSASFSKAGISGPAAANIATSWARWGSHVDPKYAQKGDVLVSMKGHRPGQTGGHVGIVTGPTVDGSIPVIEGNVREAGGGHGVKSVSERIRSGLEVRRPPAGLDANAREHTSMNHKFKGEATMNIKLAGFPRGTTHDVKMAGDLFKEVKLVRGRAMSSEA